MINLQMILEYTSEPSCSKSVVKMSLVILKKKKKKKKKNV